MLLAAHLLGISLGDKPRLCGWIVLPGGVLLDVLIRDLLGLLAVGTLVDVDDYGAAEAEVVLEGDVGFD